MKRWLGPVKHPFVSNKDPAKTGRTIYYPDWTSSITEHELGRFIDTRTRAETTQPVATDKLSWVTASAAAEWLKGISCESLKRVCPFPCHVISCPLHIWRSRFVSPDRRTDRRPPTGSHVTADRAASGTSIALTPLWYSRARNGSNLSTFISFIAGYFKSTRWFRLTFDLCYTSPRARFRQKVDRRPVFERWMSQVYLF